MITGCQDTGFRYMIAFFINIFSICTLRAIPDKSEGLKFIAIRFYNITVVDVDDRFRRSLFADGSKI